MTADAKILVAAESATDAALIGKLLSDEFCHVAISLGGEGLAGDFEHHQPSVLILAFDTLEKSERHYLGLYRHSTMAHAHPHWTLILCRTQDLLRVYELCRKRYFDDYVLFWPMTHDATRLAMAVHHGLRNVAERIRATPRTAQVVADTRPLLHLEERLDRYMAQGKRHIDDAAQSLQQSSGDAGTVMQPLGAWANAFKSQLEPQLKAASVLQAVADSILLHIMVVDDDEFQCKVLREILASAGWDVTIAGSGTAALASLGKRRPDLVLMDVNLPDMDGVEVTRRLKAVEQFAAIPVIMITGHSEKNVVVESRKAGAVDFVVKPFDRNILLAKVRHLLDTASAP